MSARLLFLSTWIIIEKIVSSALSLAICYKRQLVCLNSDNGISSCQVG